MPSDTTSSKLCTVVCNQTSQHRAGLAYTVIHGSSRQYCAVKSCTVSAHLCGWATAPSLLSMQLCRKTTHFQRVWILNEAYNKIAPQDSSLRSSLRTNLLLLLLYCVDS